MASIPRSRRRARSLPKDFKKSWEIPPDESDEYILLRSHVFPGVVFPGLNLKGTHTSVHQSLEDTYSFGPEYSVADVVSISPTNPYFTSKSWVWGDPFPKLDSDESDIDDESTLTPPKITFNSRPGVKIPDLEDPPLNVSGEEVDPFPSAAAYSLYAHCGIQDWDSDSDDSISTLSSSGTTRNNLTPEASDSEDAGGEHEKEGPFPATAAHYSPSRRKTDVEDINSDSDELFCTPPSSPESEHNSPLRDITDLEDTNSLREDDEEDPFPPAAAYSPYAWSGLADLEYPFSDAHDPLSSLKISHKHLSSTGPDCQNKISKQKPDYLTLRGKYKFLSQLEEACERETGFIGSVTNFEEGDTRLEDSEDEDPFYFDTRYNPPFSKMDRQDRDVGIVRWSQNPSRDEFMTINLNYRIVQLYEANGHAQPSRFDYQKSSKYNEFPPLSTYDWSPTIPGLVAMGTSHGEVNLLRVDDNSNSFITLPLKSPRPCQSVAFNTTGLLAVALDRVRNDFCLQIWDINQRLAGWDPKKPGWDLQNMTIEPKKLEASVSVTSVRFFEDQPQTLVAGIKNQNVRIHDLRDPSSSVITFQTRCNNNLAIDYADPNYFASSSLDQPGLVVWDRRVAGRSTASPMYLESFDQDEVPWGAVLKLDRAIEAEKNVYIRQLRYCRDQRGTLGVLSSSGQLQVFQTNKEYIEAGSQNDVRGSPELLEVKKSYDLEYPYSNPDYKRKFEDRIVSFDWITLGTTSLPARVVALRANGAFEVMQMPAATAGQLSKLIPWKPPHQLGDPYMTLMKFTDPTERERILGPLFATEATAGVPIFGAEKFNSQNAKSLLKAAIKRSLQSKEDPVIDLLASGDSKMGQTLSVIGVSSDPLTDQLSQTRLDDTVDKGHEAQLESSGSDAGAKKGFSSRELHDKSHYSVLGLESPTKSKSELLDHVMLQRAMDGYLFDCQKNKTLVGDQWLQDVWEWIAGAEQAAKDDGMIAGPLDLSYLGVYTIWMNLLGEKSNSRLIDSTIVPDATQWERLIASMNKQAGRPSFEGIETTKPHHRQLCLAICGLVRSFSDLDDDLKALEKQGKYTTAAAWALFEGIPQRAVEILRKGSTDLLFVAVALAIKLGNPSSAGAVDMMEWSKTLEDHPQMADDPYLRAIYGYITTGDWTAIADEPSLPLRDRVGVALRNFGDAKLTEWLSRQMEEATHTGDIEGIVLAGITDNMADILAKYVEKFMDYQTPILIMSFCYPRYINDVRCEAWRKAYKDFLQRHKKYILRVKFEQQSTIKSRLRDGTPVIKPPPRQVTIRCLNCDAQSANDLANSGAPPASAPGPSTTTADTRNPLTASAFNAGLCCPRCGSHLARCAVCMEIVGVPRSDRPELSNDPAVRRMSNFPSFCLKCKHVMHMDHSVAWFSRHSECPVTECHCSCNEMRNGPPEME